MPARNGRGFLIAFLAVLVLLPFPALAQSSVETGFRRFLDSDVWPAAKANGVSRSTFEAALGDVRPDLKLPDLQLPGDKAKVEETQRQAEFQTPSAYFDEASLKRLAAKGRTLLDANRATLARIEKAYGVPGPVILAIWGRESNFGAAKIPYDAFEVLATKAYLSRRKAMFREELLAALDIVAAGHLTVAEMRSSWAGALGQPQFMPTKYKAYAVDFDGDGRADIWNSVPDTLASIARYLQASGWQRGRSWGVEARVPPGLSCTGEGPDKATPVASFAAAGAAPVGARAFPKAEQGKDGHLLMPAGREGPGFVATPNFYVLKTYNNSDLYALFVANLSDRIAGRGGAFEGAWGRATGMTRGDVARLQGKLEGMGYDVGGADGLPGFKTRRSIGMAERKLGLSETCWPSKALAARLR